MNLSTLNKYNGTLYPVQDLSVLETPVTVQSLVDLCSGSIVKDSRSTQAALRVIPQDLCYSLMKAAICHDKDRSVEVLVARWPWPTLYLAKFAPEMFTSMDALYDESYIRGRMRHGIKYTTCLAHTFVECLKKRTPTRLKCLDLTGFPTGLHASYIISHTVQ